MGRTVSASVQNRNMIGKRGRSNNANAAAGTVSAAVPAPATWEEQPVRLPLQTLTVEALRQALH